MPDTVGGAFPLPPQDDQAPKEAPRLTDPIAPDLSTPPTEPEAGTETYAAPAGPEPEAPPSPALGVPAAPPPEPATFTPSRPFPLVSLLLIVIAIGATAFAAFTYLQYQNLNQQFITLSQTLENQRLQPTPTPTLTPTLELSPTPTATLAATPTPTPLSGAGLAFADVNAAIATARQSYSTAQLIMITANYVQPDNQLLIKYWFRQDAATKKYLYLLKDNTGLSLVDQQVYVTPDNNIPSLNDLAAKNQLGRDLDEAVKLTKANCPANFDCATAGTSAQFIKAATTLWQVTLRQDTRVFVVQMDSVTGALIYKSQ